MCFAYVYDAYDDVTSAPSFQTLASRYIPHIIHITVAQFWIKIICECTFFKRFTLYVKKMSQCKKRSFAVPPTWSPQQQRHASLLHLSATAPPVGYTYQLWSQHNLFRLGGLKCTDYLKEMISFLVYRHHNRTSKGFYINALCNMSRQSNGCSLPGQRQE